MEHRVGARVLPPQRSARWVDLSFVQESTGLPLQVSGLWLGRRIPKGVGP